MKHADFFLPNVQDEGLPKAQTFGHSEQDNSFAKEYRMKIAVGNNIKSSFDNGSTCTLSFSKANILDIQKRLQVYQT